MAEIQIRHPVPVLATAFVLTALAVFYSVRNMGFETSQIDLISSRNRYVQLTKSFSAFNAYDTFVVVIEGPTPPRALTFLHRLAPLLESDRQHYRQIFYRIDPNRFKPWALLYLDRNELLNLERDIDTHQALIRSLSTAPTLTGFFAGVNHEMASSMVGELFTGFLDETPSGKDGKPLDLTFVIQTLSQMKHLLDGDRSFVSPWNSFFKGARMADDPQAAYFWTKGKRYLLLFVTPQSVGEGFSDKVKSLDRLRETINRVRSGFPDIQAGVTGQDALNQDEMNTASHDIGLANLLSLSGLGLLLLIFWRGWRRPLLELIELLVALAWTFGLTTYFIGHLNILSITFPPMLLGLGIDYGIHWLARYQEEMQQRGRSRQEALKATMRRLGPSVLLAGLTAAASFFPLVLTGFKGLVEVGKITSMGMVMTTITTLGLLPALVTVFDKAPPAAALPAAAASTAPRNLFRIDTRGATVILVTGIVLLGFSLWGARSVSYDLNMLHLQSRGAESVVWEHKLLDGSDRSSMYGAMLAGSYADVGEKTRLLESLSTVSEVQSVWGMLPHHQEAKIRLLQRLRPLIAGIGPLAAGPGPVDLSGLNDLLGRIRFKMLDSSASDWGTDKPLAVQMRQVRHLIDELRLRFRGMDPAHLADALKRFETRLIQDLDDKLHTLRMNMDANPMRVNDLSPALRERYITDDGRYLMRIFPSGDIWQPAFLGRFVHDLQRVDPDAAGDPLTLYIFTRAFENATIRAAVYAVVFITLLMLLTFRNLRTALLVMTPLLIGTVWTVGLMSLFGVNFNLANSIFLPLIVGAGVEYGIIILQRYRQEGPAGNNSTAIPMSTAKGVILAGLTTTVGFGSLTISHHQGIFSLGLLAVVGSLSILTAAVAFLPALLQVLGALEKRYDHV